MKRFLLSAVVPLTLALTSVPAGATLALWQAEVNTGAAPSATRFTPVSGTEPAVINVGDLTEDRSFEFIVNAVLATDDAFRSSALLGTQVVASGRQGLKYEQWDNTGLLGVTDFGVADHLSASAGVSNVDTHIVFTSNGTETLIYVNGRHDSTFPLVGLRLTGELGLGAGLLPDGNFFDNLGGTIFGFASYDTQLSAAEISRHYDAFAVVPEPSTTGVAMLAGAAMALRRRRAAV